MAAIKTREIVASFIREKNVFVSDDLQTRTIIAQATLSQSLGGGPVTLKGEANEGALLCGLSYRFYGRSVAHHVYREQFHFESFVVDRPATREATIAYLRQCPGFGSARAGLLWDRYGESCIDELIKSPEKIAGEIKGLKIVDAKQSAMLLEKSEHVRKSKLELIELIHGRSFSKKLIDKLIDDFGSAAAEEVRKNPYLLLRYPSCGFGRVDQFYLDLGHDPAAMERQALCAWNAVHRPKDRNRGGDTWHPYNTAAIAVRDSISGTEAKHHEAISKAVDMGRLVVRDADGQKWVAETSKANHEERIARLVGQAIQEEIDSPELILWPKLLPGINVYEHQREQLTIACRGFIACLAGGPGTGKTHCAAELIKQAARVIGLKAIAACAPSGKAAVRMTEAFSKAGIEWFRATTIHSLLVWSGDGEGSTAFEYCEMSPLPYKLIVADESSMDDCWLMGCLLAARSRGCHILFLGDTEQLSPVGHGAPFRDMMAAGIPTGMLTEVQRNSGRIVQACKEIRETKRFNCSEKMDLEAGENLILLEAEETNQQIKNLEGVIERIRQGGTYDPLWDVQVLCAVNKKTSPLNRGELNKRIQSLLNPHGQSVAGSPFRIGDKVICLKNGKYTRAIQGLRRKPVSFDDDVLSPKDDIDLKAYVANGEQGEVLTVEPSRMIVRLFNPDREVIVYRKPKSDDDSNGGNGSDSDDDDKGSGCDWDLGYAVSVHKSQGSEWKIVVVMLDDSGSGRTVCTRNWIYTAISRAKTLCILIGQHKTAIEMCRRPGLQRKTFLKELIQEQMTEIRQEQAFEELKAIWNSDELEALLSMEQEEVTA